MRNIFTFLAAFFLTATLWAQSPEKMSYQAVIRDDTENLLTEQPIGIQISILQGTVDGTVVYSEIQTPTTNINGLISIEFGGESGFEAIDWADGPYFIKIETDLEGGSNYTIEGITELLSVPYAMYSKTAETVTGVSSSDITNWNEAYSWGDHSQAGYLTEEIDPSVPVGTQTGDIQYWDGTAWVTLSGAEDGQVLTFEDGFPVWKSPTYALSLNVSPEGSGEVTGAGVYEANAEVAITATSNTGYDFVNWTGDTDYIADANAASTTLTMPAQEITLTANFEEGTEVVEVLNPATGKTWMDRNLGASQVATSSDDADAYGDLYQWGRARDGHEKRTSGTTETLSDSDTPGHGDFIIANETPYDWRSPQNDDLWQGTSGVNNPCPDGYRIPTDAEWVDEHLSWDSQNIGGAFGSPLKLPAAGSRAASSGTISSEGTIGRYWSSNVEGDLAKYMFFFGFSADVFTYNRGEGASVRCIKD